MIVDEMGKFLDYASSVGSDLNLFQEIAEIFSATKSYDWIVIDMEHGTFSRSDIASIIRAIEVNEVLPFVRLLKSDITSVKNMVDLGFKGFLSR